MPHLASSLAAIVLLSAGWIVYKFLIAPRYNPLRRLAGPPVSGFWGNHLGFVLDPARSPKTHELLVEHYGRNVHIRGMGPWDDRLLTLDPLAMSHIMKNSTIYQKPWQSRRLITNLIGCGMLAAEGQVHKRQRRVATPAFGVQNMRSLVPVVFRKGGQLRDRWMTIIQKQKLANDVRLDVAMWISRATFDVIGLAGFDYHFNAIEDESNELFTAYKDMFEIAISQSQGRRSVLSLYLPIIDVLFPDKAVKVVRKSQAVIKRVAGELIQQKKRRMVEGERAGKPYEGRDLLSVLLKSNAAADLPPEQRISDEDILNNINTFMFAGSDTTSLALTWTLLLLAQNQAVQTRLRAELLRLAASVPDLSSLNEEEMQSLHTAIANLPYLDNVCKESLRLIPPVHSSLRVATQDDIVPSSTPVKIRKPNGTIAESPERSVHVPKGSFVHVPVEAFNLDKEVWGSDAWQFNPDRWDHLPEAVHEQPGLYANILTFSAGPRSCIGMRFSMIEMKTFMYILLTDFVFRETEEKIIKANVVLTRPYVKGKFGQGSQCPMLISPYVAEKSS
ncbi:cytochrome-450 hydroxylase [Punctularia strigosozonata HHB-11173 SS5]|uniref:cytochrome-450 hydroxylase n=1 Tax=Punctularia strigosozonata (strain HHB-11173) TaxID=741275 RepID=UPI0004417E4C|nr:cytochrome-450 hydroxylase [Punctularia strigosozonata HHB-11173 SS5]EIN11806.1 cytochrome-450 hydroxylase [Punctularia strigosozonata HHB-11173 SS5]